MARRRKRLISTKSYSINKNHVWFGLIILWVLYFFSRAMAEGSPIFEFFTRYSKIAFWEKGLIFFFGFCIFTGLLILFKGHLARFLMKYFFSLLMVVSAGLNVYVWEPNVPIKWLENWWYFSWPLIWLLQRWLENDSWSYIMAIKAIIAIMFVLMVAYLLYVFNIRLPKLPKINIEESPKPREKKSETKTERATITITRPDVSTEEIREKIATATGSAITAWKKSGSLLKDLIKKQVDEKVEEKRPKPIIHFSWDKPTFPTTTLWTNLWEQQTIDENFLVEKSKSLQTKLAEFWVPITIEGFDIWPSIVQIKIKPAEGIKIAAIENLANDIKLSLKSKSLRIIAPIPWTDLVGIQIPNPKPNMVKLGDVINTREFLEGMKKESTTLALWKWIDWAIQVKSLEGMPHLLIAWATGSWKSVWVNDFIISLMFQNTPAELKFLMVDPKQVELEMYSGLPYLLAPIVYDSWKAIKLLQWTVNEMERRYTQLKEIRVKNLMEYNEKAGREWKEKMYRIVFIIDEMADMMLSSSANRKEVENCINRLAAKARAVWIHLILATQRPSVNVITWLIKANIPTRIAFWVVSEIDSRTILWRKGAEDLVGKWDMLYMDPSTKFPIRIQAPFVATEEIDAVVAQLRNKYMQWLTEEDVYNPEIVAALESKVETAWGSFGWGDAWDDEDLVNQAIVVISETRKASATLLQRKLNVWFARAARIMDILEERGIVWPADGAKPRDIFI